MERKITTNYDKSIFEPYKDVLPSGLMDEFDRWANSILDIPMFDFYYEKIDHVNARGKGDWGADDNNHSLCKDWDSALLQQGTTVRKFSISEYLGAFGLFRDLSEEIRIAKMLVECGFAGYIMTYKNWRLGYDYKCMSLNVDPDKLLKKSDLRIEVCISFESDFL